MNWYKTALRKYFVGNCITGLEDPYFQDVIANDATELAQLIENSTEINYQQFLSLCKLDFTTIEKIQANLENFKFYYNKDDIVWYYDINKDVEYFYR